LLSSLLNRRRGKGGNSDIKDSIDNEDMDEWVLVLRFAVAVIVACAKCGL